MTFEDSKYSKLIPYKKVQFPFGTFYLTKHFTISEFNEGVHVDYAIASDIISHFSEEIKRGFKIGYIANRINSYSFDPQLWKEVSDDYDFLVASAVVSYTNFNHLNASLEKHFSEKSLKRCKSLDEAIKWILDLKEFKNKCKTN
jgi:hypothetical protein